MRVRARVCTSVYKKYKRVCVYKRVQEVQACVCVRLCVFVCVDCAMLLTLRFLDTLIRLNSFSFVNP